MNKIRVQFVNYKTKDYLLAALETLAVDLKEFSGDYSVAIVDNASGDDLADIRGRFPQFRNLETYQGEKNVGYAAGHNFLAKKGQAEYLLLLNTDIKFIEPETIKRLIAVLEGNQAVVAGPRLVNEKGKTQWWDHGEIKGWLATILVHIGRSYWRKRKKATEAAWVSGAVFLIDKKRFEELGGFDENFFLYKEEEDLCWRLREQGGKIIYDPIITVFHKNHVVAKKSEHMEKSFDYFLEKHLKGKFYYRILKFFNKISPIH